MDNKITSEDIKKALKLLEENEEYNYNSPIEIYQTIEQINRDILDKNEKEIMCQINQHVDVNKEELIRALNYDRGQYNKGYEDAKKFYLKTLEMACYEIVTLRMMCFGDYNGESIENMIAEYLQRAREE